MQFGPRLGQGPTSSGPRPARRRALLLDLGRQEARSQLRYSPGMHLLGQDTNSDPARDHGLALMSCDFGDCLNHDHDVHRALSLPMPFSAEALPRKKHLDPERPRKDSEMVVCSYSIPAK